MSSHSTTVRSQVNWVLTGFQPSRNPSTGWYRRWNDTGAGRMAPAASTRISARLKYVQGHGPPVIVARGVLVDVGSMSGSAGGFQQRGRPGRCALCDAFAPRGHALVL